LAPFGKRPSKVGTDRRSTPRQRLSLNGTITYGTGNSIRCSILDVSNTGALIQVRSILGIPNRFWLQEDAGPAHKVEVARRSPSRLGVKFI
jgi:hypothetical protein